MSVLSRVAWTAQQRVDLHHFLMMESFAAFDIRTLISSFVGTEKPYVLRGLEVSSQVGLSINIKVADSLTFNPKDGNGSIYTGLPDDAEVSVLLPADQLSVFVEAVFKNVSQATVNAGFWDALALTGESAGGTEFTAATNTENVIQLVISSNTVGFSEGAIPLMRAVTNASTVTSMTDCRPMLFRLASGGTNPNPLRKLEFSTLRAEPVSSGTGTGDSSVTSPWRSRDAVGILNDKGFKSFKDWADAVMTRIAEISGNPFWYYNGLPASVVSSVSLNEVFFDALGHSIQPDPSAAFIWKKVSSTLRLTGEGKKTLTSGTYHEGLVQWKSNYHRLSWHLGGSFSVSTHRNYSSGAGLRFTSPAPADGGNVYLKLEREVPKGSGSNVSWADPTPPSLIDTRTVSGSAGDFTGIALGDYIRKQSEGYSKYYKVVKMTNGGLPFDNTVVTDENRIADSSITALELDQDIDSGVSSEPLRYFRSRYSDADIFANQTAGLFEYEDADFQWLGRRVGDLFILRGYGTMQENEEVNTLNDSFIAGSSGSNDLIFQLGYGAVHDGSGFSATPAPALTIRRRKRDNTVDATSLGDNTAAYLEYNIPSTTVLVPNEGLWVRLSDTTGGTLTSGSVTNSTDDLDNTDVSTNKYEIRPLTLNVLRTADNKDVFLVARCVLIEGKNCLVFTDGSVISEYGDFLDNHLEIQGKTKLVGRGLKAVLFTNDTIDGQIDVDNANFFYDKPALIHGVFNFRFDNNNRLYQNTPADVSIFDNLGSHTVTLGASNSTTYIPGDLVVSGNTVAAQVSQIQSEDNVITLGVGNVLNGGYDSGIEVADNTIAGTSFSSASASNDVTITLASAPGYSVADVIGVSATTGIGGIQAGQIGGQYTVVSLVAVPILTIVGQANLYGSTLTIRTSETATSTATSGTTPPKAFKSEWSIKVAGSDGSTAGFTSWAFRSKSVSTTPTITPVLSYGIVPTANSTNMLSKRIPFVNDDNAGPAGVDSTLDFSSKLQWDSVTSQLNVDGSVVPVGSHTLGLAGSTWNNLYLSSVGGSSIINGVFFEPIPHRLGITNTIINKSYLTSEGRFKVQSEAKFDKSIDLGQYLLTTPPDILTDPLPTDIISSTILTTAHLRVFSSENLMFQRSYDGNIQSLTNNGNVYEEQVEVVAVPVGNNQTSAGTGIRVLPLDRIKHLGTGLVASTTSASSSVTVRKFNHDLVPGQSITITTSVAIGGISAVNLSATTTVVSTPTSDTFTYTAGASATSSASGYLDKVTAVSIRNFIVGSQELEIYLNGDLLLRGIDYTENGTLGSLSSSVTWITALAIADQITYRIDANGGLYVVNMAGGSSLQGAYLAGNTITTTLGSPVIITGAATKVLQIVGDMDVSGVIDPKGITFSPEATDPLNPTHHGLWVNSSSDLMYNRGLVDTAVNITRAITVGVPSPATRFQAKNNSGATIPVNTVVGLDGLGELQTINPQIEAEALSVVGMAQAAVAHTSTGYITTSGLIENITTSIALGSPVWVAVDGSLTATKPSIGVDGFMAGDFIIRFGTVTKSITNPVQKDLLINFYISGQL